MISVTRKTHIPIVEAARQRLKGKIHLEAVFPDYYASFPKACVGGWGRQMMLIDPVGQALPCHAARMLPGLEFPNVRDASIAAIDGPQGVVPIGNYYGYILGSSPGVPPHFPECW